MIERTEKTASISIARQSPLRMMFFLVAACLLLGGNAHFLAELSGAERKPNVIIVFTDDQGTIDANCYGAKDLVTPGIDGLAKRGVKFTQFYAAAPVCSPSRAGLLTGKYPHKTGVYGNTTNLRNAPKAKDLLTLPQYFSKHGYHTLSRGKIFHRHPWLGDKTGDQGLWAFEKSCAYLREGPTPWVWLGRRCKMIERPWVTGRDIHTWIDVAASSWYLTDIQTHDYRSYTEL